MGLRYPLSMFLMLFVAMPLWAADEVSYLDDEGKPKTAKGTLVKEMPQEVIIKSGTQEMKISFDRITEVKYDKQPPGMGLALGKEENGAYAEAIEDYKNLFQSVPDDAEYLQAAIVAGVLRCQAALAPTDPQMAEEALKSTQRFLTTFPNSYHHFPAQEILGQVALQLGNYDLAKDSFGKLRTAKVPGYAEKAAFWEGVLTLKQGNAKGAVALFDQVLSSSDNSEAVSRQKQLAQIWKGEALLKSGNAESAKQLLEATLPQLPPDAYLEKALGHNALGDALQAAGRPAKETMLDGYLWVTTIYNRDPEQLARALYQLSQILPKIPDGAARAQVMRQRLHSEFPNSPWTSKLSAN